MKIPSDSTIFSPENNLKSADFVSINDDTLPQIVRQFNQENNSTTRRPSILKNINFLGFSLFTYRMVEKNQLRLVQRNGIPELAGHSGYYQRRIKIWSLWKPWTWFRSFRDNSSTIGIYNISGETNDCLNKKGHIGYGDRHLVNVNPGDFAKVIINSEPILLDVGVHIIKTNNFSYLGKVSQSMSFIKHENLYRIQVPSAKLAAVIVDNEPHLLKTGTHYFRSNNFEIKQKILSNNSSTYFYNNEDSVISCGSLLRVVPPPNSVAVYNIGPKQYIFPDRGIEVSSNAKNKEDSQVQIDKNGILEIKNPNAKFVTFLKTDLINKDYPTGKPYFTYYTKDSVQVGVKLFVAYRIIDPKLSIEKLGPTGIDGHIEHVTHVDMARAGQETSLQGIQSSSDLKIVKQSTSESENDDNPPAYHQIYLSTWQESVKKQLEKDLKEYGIELVRLNIEEINILNKDVEKEMGKQAVEVARANADLAAIQMQREVALQKAQSDSAVARLNAQQNAESNLILAENKKKVAELDKETTRINAEAKTQALQLLGDKLAANPSLLQHELNKEACNAIATTQIHSLFFADGKNSPLFNNQMGGLPIRDVTNSPTNS